MDAIYPTCKKCDDTQLEVEDIKDDNSKVSCPACGTDFGSWGDVKAQLKTMLGEHFKDHPWITVS